MAGSFTGTFATSEVKVKVKTGSNVYSEIADMESAALQIDTNVETWYSIKDGGWQNALVTAKAWKLSMSGKRSYGDVGNDYLAGLALKNGRDCNTEIKLEFPDGSVFQGFAAAAVQDFGVNEATGVSPLSVEFTSQGKPSFTSGSGTSGNGGEEIEDNGDDNGDDDGDDQNNGEM